MATLFNTKIKDTYQSLLKLEDNTILTTTTKNITDGLGNASPLYMSTTRVGIGTNAPISTLNVLGLSTFIGASGNILGSTTANAAAQFYQNGFNGVLAIGGYSNGGGEIQSYQGGGANAAGSMFLQRQAGNVLIGSASDTAKLSVKGSGSTSATTSFLVQNSSGTADLTVRDDLYVFGGSRVYSTGNMYMDGNSGTLFSAWGQLNLQGASYVQIMNDTLRVGSQNFNFINTSFSPNNSTNSNLILNGNGSSFTNAGAGSTSVGNVLSIPIGLSTSTGNVTLNHINIDGVINTTAGTTLQRGFYYNPTLTGTVGFTHRAIETVTGNVLLGTTSGNVGIGTSTPGNRLSVNGLSDFTLVGNNNHGKIVRVQNTDSTNTTFGLGIETYSDGTGNRSVDLVPYNHTGANLAGTWSINTLVVVSDLRNNYWSDFNIYHWNSNAGQAIKFHSLGPSGSGGVIVQFVNNGNVQIGTTTDSGYKLDVSGTARFSGAVTAGINNGIFADIILDYNGGTRRIRPGGNSLALTDSLGNRAFQINAGGGNPQIALEHDGVNFVRGLVSLQYTMGSTQQMVLTASNYVGHLTPFFDIKATGYANSKNTDLRLYTDNTTSGTYGNIIIGHNGTNATGNVGVGEASPTARLQVKGSGSTSATTALLVQNSAGTTTFSVNDAGELALPSTAPKITLGGDLTITSTVSPTRQMVYDVNNSNLSVYSSGLGEGYFIGNRFTQSRSSTTYVTPNALNDTGGALITSYDSNGNIAINASNNGNRSIALKGLGTTGCVLIGNITTANGTSYSSILRMDSTTQGFLPPRMTTAQKNAIASPAEGLMVYDSTLKRPCFFDGTSWVTM
jgi:hypothetical protein